MSIAGLLNRVFPERIAGQRRPRWVGLFAPQEMQRILAREQERADRSGGRFSLLVFSVGSPQQDRETLAELVRVLQRRLRWTDEAGWLDRRRVGVVLSNTPPHGAWTLADDVCLAFPADVTLPECHVYAYPTRRPAEGARGDEVFLPGAAEGEAVSAELPPVHAMSALLLKPMPAWKRALDVVGAVTGLILLWPLMAAAALAVRLSSPGPVLFAQSRDGQGGKPFTMYKFRTMVVDAEQQQEKLIALNEQQGPVFKIRNDPRVTPVGRLLRKTSIDELPQLWNVLKGEMSLVGPRPPLRKEVRQYQGWQRHRLDVTPGLTCIWQVQGRSQVPFLEWMRMDMRYIRSRSLLQDLGLLLRTVLVVLSRRGAQ
jgi:lipopolysaccharide/colanic/teichoic acid biosynthesis glycosyltransferase